MSDELPLTQQTGTTVSDARTSVTDPAPNTLWVGLDLETKTVFGNVGGVYEKVPQALLNGAPVWEGEQHVFLFRSSAGEWAFAHSMREAECNEHCGVVSADAVALPHQRMQWTSHNETVDLCVLPSPHRETTVEQLQVFMCNNILHNRYERHLPYYLFYITCITLLICRLPNGLRNPDFSESYWVGRGAADGANRAALEGVASEDGMWDWMGNTLDSLWETSHIDLNVTYTESPLLSDRGEELLMIKTKSAANCQARCDRHPYCNSFAFSLDCQLCYLYTLCMDVGTNMSALPHASAEECPTLRSYLNIPCDPGKTMESSKNYTFRSQNTAATAFESYGVAFATISQARVTYGDCPHTYALHEYDKDKVPLMCAGTYSSGSRSTADFGLRYNTTTRDVPQFTYEMSPDGNPRFKTIETMTTLYPSTAYTQRLDYEQTLPETKAQLAELRQRGFVDEQTRIVVLSFVLYFPANSGFFTYFQGYVEYLPTGTITASWQAVPFQLLNLDDKSNYLVMVLDASCFLAAIVFLLSFFSTIRVKLMLKEATRAHHVTVFGIWELFELSHVISMCTFVTFRIFLWATNFKSGKSGFLEDLSSLYDSEEEAFISYCFLVDVAIATDLSNVALGYAVIFSYLRLFKYVQFNRRFNALSETIKGASYNLLIMTVIFLVILVAFSLGGCVMFGHRNEEFRSFSTSMSYLLRSLLGGSMDGWSTLHDTRPDSSWAFLVLYFLISWLLLLNMVLAIIAESFSVVHESMQGVRPQRFQLSVKAVKRFFSGVRTALAERRQETAKGAHMRGRYNVLYVSREVLCARDPSSLQVCSIMRQVRRWSEQEMLSGDTNASSIYITALQFRNLCKDASRPLTVPAEVHRIFTGAESQLISGASGTVRESERRFHTLQEHIVGLEERLAEIREVGKDTKEDHGAKLAEITALLQQLAGKGGVQNVVSRTPGSGPRTPPHPPAARRVRQSVPPARTPSVASSAVAVGAGAGGAGAGQLRAAGSASSLIDLPHHNPDSPDLTPTPNPLRKMGDGPEPPPIDALVPPAPRRKGSGTYGRGAGRFLPPKGTDGFSAF